MPVCKQCGKQFRYDDEVGYATDLCGPLCDGVYSQRHKIDSLTEQLVASQRILFEIRNTLSAKDSRVLGWHLNGNTEPLDSWFEDNAGWLEETQEETE